MTSADRELCDGLSALLRCGSLLGCWSGGVTFVAACSVVSGLPTRTFMAGGLTLWVLCLGMFNLWLTLRLQLDAHFFGGLGSGRIATLASLDATLNKLGMVHIASRSVRSLPDRQRGALSILKRQVLCTGLQTVSMICLLALISLP